MPRTADERVEYLAQDRSIDDWPAIPDFQANLFWFAGKHHINRSILCSVLDRVHYQIVEHPLQAHPIEEAPGVARHVELHPAVRMGGAQLVQLSAEQRGQVDVSRSDVNPHAQFDAIELQQ